MSEACLRSPLTPPDEEPSADPAVQAAIRALPLVRLEDYGVAAAEARLLHDLVRSGIAWPDAARDLAGGHLDFADAMRAEGLPRAAVSHQLDAAVLMNVGQVPVLDDAVKRDSYVDSTRTLSSALLDTARGLEFLDAGTSRISALRLRPDSNGPRPTILIWGGLSGWGIAYLRMAKELARSGFGCVLVELPGQGVPRLFDQQYMDETFLEPIAELCAILGRDPSVSSIGIIGNSMGGLFAARAAAAIEEVRACCINSGLPNPLPALAEFPRLAHQWRPLLGIGPEDDPRPHLGKLVFDPAAHKIDVPMLILHGGRDNLVSRAEQQSFVDGGIPGKVRLFTWAEAQHCLYDRRLERDRVIAEWLQMVLD